jgi:Cu/Ag efflux pump CusA
MDLREIQDWIIKPLLKSIPGVVEVNSIGGFEKQYHVTPHPDRLVAFKLTFRDRLVHWRKTMPTSVLVTSKGTVNNISSGPPDR